MLESLTIGGIVQGGATALLAIVTLGLVRMSLGLYRKIDAGELVPKATLETLEVARLERLADLRTDRDAWRKAYETASKQVDQLMEYAETTDAFIRSLREQLAGRSAR